MQIAVIVRRKRVIYEQATVTIEAPDSGAALDLATEMDDPAGMTETHSEIEMLWPRLVEPA